MVLYHRSPIRPKLNFFVYDHEHEHSHHRRADLPILPTTPLLPLVKIQQHRRPDIDNNIYSFTKDATARHRRHDANVFINSNSRGYIIMKQNTFDRRWVSSTLADVISFSTVEIFIYYYIQQLLTRLCFLKINHRFVGLIRCWSLGLFALFSIDACFQF